MERNNGIEKAVTAESNSEENKITPKRFFTDLLAGYGIGVAFIIPGFSGGSMAAIFGIYERLIGAIAGVFKHFKESIITLLPIFVGLCLGAVSLLYPLGWALSAFPLPTVSLFVGLTIGAMPSLIVKVRGKIRPTNVIAFLIPLAAALLICLMPTGADVNLFALDFGGYLLLFVIGVVGSSALVIPGISGSMLLLILGYYNPIVELITEHLFKFRDVGVSILVLTSVGLGIVIGFFLISILMRFLLQRYTRGTYFAIIGFILGSLPAAFVSTAKDAGYTAATLPTDAWHWVACALLLILGVAISLFLVIKSGALRSRERGE